MRRIHHPGLPSLGSGRKWADAVRRLIGSLSAELCDCDEPLEGLRLAEHEAREQEAA